MDAWHQPGGMRGADGRPAGGLGAVVRRRRQQLSLTLAQLAEAAGCSKAYLSGIENGRHANPPSPGLVRALEQALDVSPGELARLADWQSTPAAVRADYQRLADQLKQVAKRRGDGAISLDALLRDGSLRRCVEESSGNLDPLPSPCFQVPLINKVAAGYPRDFTDLDYPARVADEYVSCPGVEDVTAFAARVAGDSMLPEYRPGDIIVFSPEREATEGSDCFARLLPDHESTFKRVYFEGADHIRLQPLNPAFAPRTVPREQIDGLYPAVFRIQKLGGTLPGASTP
ncbi:MAG: S24 family peptidase [Phycisphaeraceae bacterium]